MEADSPFNQGATGNIPIIGQPVKVLNAVCIVLIRCNCEAATHAQVLAGKEIFECPACHTRILIEAQLQAAIRPAPAV